jgi:ferritin
MSLPQEVCSALNELRQQLHSTCLSTLYPIKGYFDSLELNGYKAWVENRITTATNRITSIEDFITANGCQQILLQAPDTIPGPSNPISALSAVKIALNQLADESMGIFLLQETQQHAPAAIYMKSVVEEQCEEESTSSEIIRRSIAAFIPNNPPKFGLEVIDSTLP